MHTKRLLSAAFVLLAALSLTGCGFFNSLFGLEKDEKTKDATSSVVTIYTLIDDMSRSLVSASVCTASEAKVLVDGANAAAAADTAHPLKTDLQALIPVAVGGTVSSLGSATFNLWDDAKKIACVDAIVASFVASLDGKFAATSQARSMRALSDSAAMVNDILASISMAAIDNLSKTGISEAGLADAAGGVVASIIGSLGDGGVNKVLVNSAVGSITQSAVATLRAAGFSDGEAMELAVQAITQGAVTALSSVTIVGVTAADYPGLATQIAKSAATAIGSFATIDQVAGLVGAAASGAAQGIVAADAHLNISADIVSLMAEGIVSGGTSGAMTISFVDPASSGASLIAAITSQSSTILTANLGALAVSEADLLTDVTVGAASGAVSSGGYASTAVSALTSAISLIGNNGLAATVTGTDVQSGIAKGDNEAPVVNAGPAEIFAKAGEAVVLKGSATDADGDALTYAWSLVQRPSTSSQYLAITGSNLATASFTPDVGGPYILSLLVTDTNGATGEAFRVVTAVAATSATYQGINAEARLASATSYMDSGEFAKARDELLILLTYYPETSLSPEATLKLSRCYKKLGNKKLAIERLLEVVALYPSSSAEPKARLDLGWLYLDAKDFEAASVQFDLLFGRATADVIWADAVRGQGLVLLRQATNHTEILAARERLIQARESDYADVYVRYYAQSSIAESYQLDGDIAYAVTEIRLTFTEARYNCADPDDLSTKLVDLVFKSVNDLFWGYHYMGLFQDAIDLADEQLASATEFAPWMRLRLSRIAAERELWDLAPIGDNFLDAKKRLVTALEAPAGSDFAMKEERDWAQLRLGQANGRLADVETDPELRNDLIGYSLDAYNAVAADFGSAWGTRQAGEAKLEKAIYILFGTRDYAAAEALLLDIVAKYPYDIDQYPRAATFLRLGDVYRERGFEAKDKYGLDGTASFNQAIFYYNKVKPELFPGLGEGEWFFAEAARNIGSCLSGLGRYADARSQLTPLLGSTAIDIARKAQIQLSIAETYSAQLLGLAKDGDFSSADYSSLLASAVSAFTAVSDYKNGADYPDGGQESAQAWAELARLYADLAQRMQDSGYSDTAARMAAWQSGIDNYAKVIGDDYFAMSWDLYPSLDKANWVFREALRESGRCLEGLGEYGQARDVYAAFKANITAGFFPAADSPDIVRRLARTHQNEAERLDWKASAGNRTTAFDLFEQAIAAYAPLYTAPVDVSDGGWAAADSLADNFWCYVHLFDLKTYDASEAGDDALLHGYVVKLADLLALGKDGVFKAADGSYLADGRYVGRASYIYGVIQKRYAEYLRNIGTGWSAASIGYLVSALTSLSISEDAAYPGMNPDEVADARCYATEANIELCMIKLIPGAENFPAAIGYFNAALGIVNSVAADPESNAPSIARTALDMAWAYIEHGGSLVTHHLSFVDEAYWRAQAKYWLDLVKNTPAYYNVDIWVAERCDDGLQWLIDHP